MSTLTVGAAGIGGEYDYTCDGAADQVEIIAALATAGAGGSVTLSAGAFACTAGFDVPVGTSLAGAAGYATTLALPNTAAYIVYLRGSNTITDLVLTGGITVSAEGSTIACSRLKSHQEKYGAQAFRVTTQVAIPLIEDVTFSDCHAIDTSGSGWMVNTGTTTDTVIRNLTLSGCTAVNCGKSHDLVSGAEWVTGFNLGEAQQYLTVENAHVLDCTASGCYESGFFTEGTLKITNCRIERCTSTLNGRDKPNPTFGLGFRLAPNWYMLDCVADRCHAGIRIENSSRPGSAYYLGPIRVVGCQVLDPVTDGIHVKVIIPEHHDARIDRCTVRGVSAPNHVVWLNNTTGAIVSDLVPIGCTGDLYETMNTTGTTWTYVPQQIGVSPAAPVTGEAVAFTDATVLAQMARAWDFGDGSGSAAQHPTHAYPTAGVYPVALTSGGNTVSATVTVRPGVSYGGARLSEADLAPLDHEPTCNATDLQNGRVGLQGSPVSRRTWTINALTDDRAEIEALAALAGQHLILNINGTEYPGTMIRPPMLETQLTPAAWAYQVGFVQETRR